MSATWAENRLLFSRLECARLLNLSVRSIDRLLDSGRLSSVHKGRRRLVTRDQLLNFAGQDIREKLAA